MRVVVPLTSVCDGNKLPSSCHWYISGPMAVVAVTVNVTDDPGSTFNWSTGC